MLKQPPSEPTVSLELALKTVGGRLLADDRGEQILGVREQSITKAHTQTYRQIEQHLSLFLNRRLQNQWLLMPGLRGTGKTTILKQLYRDDKLQSLPKYYLSFDQVKILDPKSRMFDTINALEKVLESRLEDFKSPFVLLLDEVQYVEDWALGLKTIFDRCPDVFILAAGFPGLLSQINSDVARRVDIVVGRPLNLTDFINIQQFYATGESYLPPKDLDQNLNLAFWQSSNEQQVFERLQALELAVRKYWRRLDRTSLLGQYQTFGSLPYTSNLASELVRSRWVYRALEAILIRDIAAHSGFSSQTLAAMPRLLMTMAHAGCRSLNSLAKDLGFNIQTLQNMIYSLEQAGVVKTIKPWGAKSGHLTKSYRHLFGSPAIRMALIDAGGRPEAGSQLYDRVRGFLWEDIAGLYLGKMQDENQQITVEYETQPLGGVFIRSVGAYGEAIAVEIGPQKSSSQQAARIRQRVKARYGLVVTNSDLKLDKRNKIVYLPFEFFLLLQPSL